MKLIQIKPYLLPFLLSISLLLSACTFLTNTFDRKNMLIDITNDVILPTHEAFVKQSELLEEAVDAFEAQPTLEGLEALQAQWKETSLAWMGCELFKLGAVQESLIHNQIYKWPTNPELIEEHLLKVDSIDQTFISSIGSTSKGLPAIESLIFSQELDNSGLLNSLTDAPDALKRMPYLVALVKELHHQAKLLWGIWSSDAASAAEGQNALSKHEGYAEDFISADSDGGELQSSISMLTNAMVAQLEGMLSMKLAKPLGRSSYGTPQPLLVEAGRSEQSLPHLIANLETFKIAFNGGASEDALGFDDYLNFLDAHYEDEALSAKINAQTDAALAALKQIEQPLGLAVKENPGLVGEANGEIKQLLVLIKVDMANHFGVTITFNDNDGD